MSHLPTLGGASGPPIPFPPAVLTHLDLETRPGKPVGRGKVVAGSELGSVAPIAIVYQGPNLEVLCPRTGERLAAWTFKGDDDRKSGATKHHHRDEFDPVGSRLIEITCVAEMAMTVSRHSASSNIPSADDASFVSSVTSQRHSVRRLVVAGLSTGLVCIIDIKSCRLIRAVRMPYRVTAVAVLSNGSIGSSDDDEGSASPVTNRNLAEELLFFQGVIAVGTQEGHLYYLDAALDLPDADESEKNPSDLHFLATVKRKKVDNLAALRTAVHQRGERLCIPINDEAYSGAKRIFQYVSNMTGETTYFPEEGVVVSCLQYAPQLGNLLVGFNFGSWQMWNTSRLVLEFASSYEGSEPSTAGSAATKNNGSSLSTLPVTNFAFSEPENDPRNFCYVWVARGENDFDTIEEKSESLNSKATLSMYALSYKNRDDGGELYGALYTGLIACSLRFDHTLLGDPQLNAEYETTGSTCLACYTLGSSSGPLSAAGNGDADLNDDSDPDSLLCKVGISLFLWEVQFLSRVNPAERTTKFYMGLFDLNAWYQAQMPIQVELEPQTQCSYFSFCSMDDVTGQNDDDDTQSPPLQQLIDVWIDTSTLSRHNQTSTTTVAPTASGSAQLTTLRPEQHFYPSSLAFDLICLLDQGFVHASHLGLQRKVLLELQSQGRSGLVDPSDLYQLCRIAGLIVTSGVATHEHDICMEEYSRSSNEDEEIETGPRISPDDKRSALLTVALEHNLINLLTGCVFHWSDGKYSEAGCTLKFILDWAWNSISNIKQAVDKATLSLFDWSGLELNEGTRRSLMQRSQQLHHLCTLIKRSLEVVTTSANRWRPLESQLSNDGQLKLKLHLAQLISTYLDVILWFLNAGLLPEQSEDSGFSLFPSGHMSKVYSEKRDRMKAQLAAWGEADCLGQEERFKETSCLLIDGLCRDLGDQFKTNLEREGGKGVYPPPTLHALLVSYLIHNADSEDSNTSANLVHKHRLIQYLFLDLASCLTNNSSNRDDGNSVIVESLIKFPSAFGMPNSVIKLTQAFWLVDHEDFDEAISMLLDPLVCGNDITDWQHRAILMAFLIQDRPKLALKYTQIRQPPQKDITDIQLHIAVLLANGMVHESFQFLRRRWSSGLAQDSARDKQILLYYFFNRCDALGKLDSILQLPMMLAEERILVDFLLNSDERKINRKETLLLYYLQRARYSEAIALNEQLEKRNGGNENSKTRKTMMERYAHLLPKLRGHDLGSLQSRWPASTTTYAQPIAAMMSAALASKSIPNPTFQSSAAFRKISEVQTVSNEFTPFRPRHKRRKWEENDETISAVIQPNGGDSHQDNLAPNSKRSRLDTFESPAATPSRPAQNALLSVLTTPLIDRKAGSILGRTYQGTSLLGGPDASERSMTPHSILKVKGAISSSNVPSDSPLSMLFAASLQRRTLDRSAVDDDEEEAEDNWLVKHRQAASVSRESTPGKSLRFNVPKRLPPADLVTPEASSCEPSMASPNVTKEISSLSTSRVEPEKKKEDSGDKIVSEKSKVVTLQRKPEDDDSIVLVSDDDGEEEEEETEDQNESDVEEKEQVDEASDVEEVVQYDDESEVEEIDVDSSEEEDVQEEECTAEEEKFASFASTDTSVAFASNKTLSEHTMYGHQDTMPVDVDLVRMLASRDLQPLTPGRLNNTMAASNVSALESDQSYVSGEKGSNVTIYGHDETMAVDVSLVRNLAQRDLQSAAKAAEEEFKFPSTPRFGDRLKVPQVDRSSVSSVETSMYGHDVTMPVDVSFVRRLVEKDLADHRASEEVSNMSTNNDETGNVSILKEDNCAEKFDLNLIVKMADKDRASSVQVEEPEASQSIAGALTQTKVDSDLDKSESETARDNVTIDSSINVPEKELEKKAVTFSFSEPKELLVESATADKESENNKSVEFKFDAPESVQLVQEEQSSMLALDTTAEVDLDFVRKLAQKDLASALPTTPLSVRSANVSTLEPLNEDDSGEITFKTTVTPRAVPESPSVKKRKRFTEAVLASVSHLESILEEDSATPPVVLGVKEERFRVSKATPTKRLRSVSATHTSPMVLGTPSRRRSSQSASDASVAATSPASSEQQTEQIPPAEVSAKVVETPSTVEGPRRRTRSSRSGTEIELPAPATTTNDEKISDIIVETKVSVESSVVVTDSDIIVESERRKNPPASDEKQEAMDTATVDVNVEGETSNIPAADNEPREAVDITSDVIIESEPSKNSPTEEEPQEAVRTDDVTPEIEIKLSQTEPEVSRDILGSHVEEPMETESAVVESFKSFTPEKSTNKNEESTKSEFQSLPDSPDTTRLVEISEPSSQLRKTSRSRMSSSISYASPNVSKPRRRTKSSLSETENLQDTTITKQAETLPPTTKDFNPTMQTEEKPEAQRSDEVTKIEATQVVEAMESESSSTTHESKSSTNLGARQTRRTATVSQSSPYVVKGITRRRTRSTLSESEEVEQLQPVSSPARIIESQDVTAPTLPIDTPSTEKRTRGRAKNQSVSVCHPSPIVVAVESSSKRRTRSALSETEMEPVVIPKTEVDSKSVESPSRKSKRSISNIPDASYTSTQNDESSSSQSRRTTRKSASSPAVAVEAVTQRQTTSSSSETESGGLSKTLTPARRSKKIETPKESTVDLSGPSASPLPRTPGRRVKASLSVTQLSPILEKQNSGVEISNETEAVESSPPKSVTTTPSRTTRRSSVASASPAITADVPKRTRKSSKSVVEPSSDELVSPRSTRRTASSTEETSAVVVDVPVKRTRSTVMTPAKSSSPVTVVKAAPSTPSRRTSTRSATSQSTETGSKRTTRHSSHDDGPSTSKAGNFSPPPADAGSSPSPKASKSRKAVEKASNATSSSRTRKSIYVDPFSPAVEDIPEESNEEPKRKRKYLVKRTIKSHKLV